jgi:thiamine-monophosphate kinase
VRADDRSPVDAAGADAAGADAAGGAGVDEDGVVAAIRAVFAAHGVCAEAEDADAWRIDHLHPSHAHTDVVVEGVDFDRALYPLAFAGHRALAQNLSDLAAVDADPTGFFWGLAIPSSWSLADTVAFARGAAALAAAAQCPLLGGDLSRTGGAMTAALTVLGRASGLSVARSGAKPGQGMWLTRRVGASARGLRLLQAERPGEDEATFRRWLDGLSVVDRRAVLAHVAPTPFHHLEQLSDFAVAAIDVSDGLARDAARLARTSKVGIDLDRLDDAIDTAAGASADDALRGGEDWAVLFAVPEGLLPPGCIRVGRVVAGAGVRVDGIAIDARGYDHFR